jgi:Domain of unknown function (DUF4157)
MPPLRPSQVPGGFARGGGDNVPVSQARMPLRRPSQVPVGIARDYGVGAPGQKSPVLEVVGKGGGQPLDPRVRADMESHLDADFSDVRIHTDAKAANSAAAVSAQAYTVGHEVVFGHSSFAPASPEGRHRLAHELVHVQQQRKGPVPGTDTGSGVAVSDPSDSFEQEAEATANRVVSGLQPVAGNGLSGAPQGRSPVQRAGSPSVQRCGGMPCDCETDEESSVQRSSADALGLQPVQRAMVCPVGVDPAEGTGCYEVPDTGLPDGNSSSQAANDNAQDLSGPANDYAAAQDGVLDIDTLVRTLAPFFPDLEPESDQAQVQTTVQRHTKADCDEQYDQCSDRCRQLPPNDKRRRALCWAACMAAYAACLATADETLITAAIIAAIVLEASDGPLPFGDAAAAALLLAVRARVGN